MSMLSNFSTSVEKHSNGILDDIGNTIRDLKKTVNKSSDSLVEGGLELAQGSSRAGIHLLGNTARRADGIIEENANDVGEHLRRGYSFVKEKVGSFRKKQTETALMKVQTQAQ